MKEFLSEKNIKFAYVDVCSSVGALRSYMKIRDTSPSHAQVRENHSVGLPSLAVDDQVYLIVGGVDYVKELVDKLQLAQESED